MTSSRFSRQVLYVVEATAPQRGGVSFLQRRDLRTGIQQSRRDLLEVFPLLRRTHQNLVERGAPSVSHIQCDDIQGFGSDKTWGHGRGAIARLGGLLVLRSAVSIQ